MFFQVLFLLGFFNQNLIFFLYSISKRLRKFSFCSFEFFFPRSRVSGLLSARIVTKHLLDEVGK